MAAQCALTAGADSVDAVVACLRRAVSKVPSQTPAPQEPHASSTLQGVITAAQRQQTQMGDMYLALDHLLHGLSQDKSTMRELQNAGITKQSLVAAVEKMRNNKKADTATAETTYNALSTYGVNLCQRATDGKLDPVIGRDDEIRRVIQVLARRTKNNPVLIGEPGVGKTAIAEGLAQRIVSGDVPESLKSELWSLDMGALVAGAKYRGEFEVTWNSSLTPNPN